MANPLTEQAIDALKRALFETGDVDAAARAAGISRRAAFRFVEEHKLELAVEALRRAPAVRFLFSRRALGVPRIVAKTG